MSAYHKHRKNTPQGYSVVAVQTSTRKVKPREKSHLKPPEVKTDYYVLDHYGWEGCLALPLFPSLHPTTSQDFLLLTLYSNTVDDSKVIAEFMVYSYEQKRPEKKSSVLFVSRSRCGACKFFSCLCCLPSAGLFSSQSPKTCMSGGLEILRCLRCKCLSLCLPCIVMTGDLSRVFFHLIPEQCFI